MGRCGIVSQCLGKVCDEGIATLLSHNVWIITLVLNLIPTVAAKWLLVVGIHSMEKGTKDDLCPGWNGMGWSGFHNTVLSDSVRCPFLLSCALFPGCRDLWSWSSRQL